MFKRKKKKTEEIVIDDAILESDDLNTGVADEIAEEIIVYETSYTEHDVEAKMDNPTVRIPDLKELTDELVLAEAAKLLEETEEKTQQDNQVVERTNFAQDDVTAELLSEETNETKTEKTTADSLEEKKPIVIKKKKAQKGKPRNKRMSAFAKKKRFKYRVQLVSNIIMWFVSIFLFVFCLSNLYQQILNEEEALGFFDMGNAIVVSESMVPTLEKDDFIVYKATEIEQLRPQDIVVYKRPVAEGHILIVHRLLAITDGYAITQGDNNAIQDDPFDAENIVGKVILTVPQLGKLMEALSSFSGILAIVLLFVILVLSQLIYRKMTYNMWMKKLAKNKEERKAVQMFLEM